MRARVLFIDDDAAVCDAVRATLEPHDFEVVCAHSGASALQLMATTELDVVVTDLNMPEMSGLELCRRAHARWPQLPVILITAFGSVQNAVGALRAGAYDFISKPIQIAELLRTLERVIEQRRLRQQNEPAVAAVAGQRSRPLRSPRPKDETIGECTAMREVYAMVKRLSTTDATALITGESGTGKELIAKAVHESSSRSSGPLVAINCAAIQPTLLESELFGHVRGAFTDAHSARRGLFLEADRGTLFLDEIGEMPLSTQVKLLRALQERVVRPVGGERELPFDVRVVAATSRDLEREVAAKRFRDDLYYRINVIHLPVPALRTRGQDIILIAEHYIQCFAEQFNKAVSGLEPQVVQKLLVYPWYGNVRELKNCMERAVALTDNQRVTLEDLPERIRAFDAPIELPPAPTVPGALTADVPAELLSMEEVERRHVLQVMHAVHGKRSEAARTLGFDRRTLYRKLKSYGQG